MVRSIRTRSRSVRVDESRVVARACLGAMLVLLVACSPPDDRSAGTEGDRPVETPSVPQDEPDSTPSTCPDPVLAGIEQTIGSQLDAFADDDVAGALSYASEAFRGQTDADSFERLISDAFPAVADPASFSIEGCRSEQASAQVLVGVVGADGGRMRLVYVMVEEADRWAIDGAREMATDPGLVA